MSLRIDSTEWITGSLIIGETGLGVLAELIPSTGDNGPSYLYNDLSFPADNGKEICGRITSWPSAGTLFAYEDGSFSFTGAPDGSYQFQYQLYVNGTATGSPATVDLLVGVLTLYPSLFTNSNTFFAPTVTPGPVTITPALFTNSNTFFAPTVTPGPVTVTPALFTNSNTFFLPTVILEDGSSPSLRQYISGYKSAIYIPATRDTVFISNSRNYIVISNSRTATFQSGSRTTNYIAPSRSMILVSPSRTTGLISGPRNYAFSSPERTT